MRVFWPHIEQVSRDVIREHVEPKIKAALPEQFGGAFSIDADSLKLGDIEKNRVELYDEWATIDAQPAEPRDIYNARYYVNFEWTGDCFLGIHLLGAALGVAHVKVQGSVLIVLAALSVKSVAGEGLRFSFLQPPDVQFDLTGIGKALQLAPMFKRSLQDVLKDKVSEICVLPNWMAFAWPRESRLIFPIRFPQPAGFLRLSVHSAHGLRGSDTVLETKVFSCLRNTRSVACRGRLSQMSTGASDPYFVLECGAQRHTSEIRWKTLSPVYNATFVLAVSDVRRQHVRLEFWDKDLTSQDDFLAKATIPVSSIVKWRAGERKKVALEDELVGPADSSCQVLLSAEWLPLRRGAPGATRPAEQGPRPEPDAPVHLHARRTARQSSFRLSTWVPIEPEAMYLVDLGVYDAVHVTYVGSRVAYWLCAECEGAVPAHWGPAQETKKVHLEPAADHEEAAETARRLKLMRQHGMSLDDAASILDLDVEVLAHLESELNATTVTTEKKLTFNHMFRFLVPWPAGPREAGVVRGAKVEVALMRQGEGLLDYKVVVGRAEVAISDLLSEDGAPSTLRLPPSSTSLKVHMSATAVGGP